MTRLRVVPPGQTVNDNARRVSLMHETSRTAEKTTLPVNPLDRLTVLVENVQKLVAAVGHDEMHDLRNALLAISVQSQLWLNEIDRGDAA